MENTELTKLKEELEYWKYYEAVNNMGRWSKQVRVDKLKEKIEILEKLEQVEPIKNEGGSYDDLFNKKGIAHKN
jgi:hypothetical protein